MMSNTEMLTFNVESPTELNLSYMPFISNGGLFIATEQTFSLGEKIFINLQLPGVMENLIIEGKVIWITPANALHHTQVGIGIQFSGNNSQSARKQIEVCIDPSMDVGGYTYGIIESSSKIK